ncbi:hypothetical protein [Ventosimonas gracilis]|uniref:hypothetical protein n=1 Tax=Ventosimonas gracilis TaxID=1680762 RepID=UPI000B18DCBD
MAGQISSTEVDDLDYSATAVPADKRMPKMALTMAWWAVCSAVFYVVVGAAMALNFGTRNAIIGLVLTIIVYGVINTVLSRFAITPSSKVRSLLSASLPSRRRSLIP